MQRFIYLILLSLILFTCTKDKIPPTVPYSKQNTYESFDNNPNWTLLPKDSIFTPDTTCVRVADSFLKMLFDQPINNCGCAWVGAGYMQQNALLDSFITKIGIRIKLNEGYFQYLSTYFDTVYNGHPAQIGKAVSFSHLILNFNCLDIQIPNSSNGRFQRDSTLDLNSNKLIGTEFEIIYDNGEKIFKIDGVEHSASNLYFNWQNILNQPLNIQFELGHLPQLSSRLDKLFIDEIEIYTWNGER